MGCTAAGELWAWGYNAKGLLGLGDEKNRVTPTRVEGVAGRRVRHVTSGDSATFVIAGG